MKAHNPQFYLLTTHENDWHWGTSVDVISTRGLGRVELSFENDNPGVAYLSGLIVLEPCRGKGLATTMLDHCEGICRKRGVFRIDLDSVNVPFVVKMYERRGFKTIKQEEHTTRMYKMLEL